MQHGFAHGADLAVNGLADVTSEHVAKHGNFEQVEQQYNVARKRTERVSRRRNDHQTERRRQQRQIGQGVKQRCVHALGNDSLFAQQLHEVEERLEKWRALSALQPGRCLARDPQIEEPQRAGAENAGPHQHCEDVSPEFVQHDFNVLFWSAVAPSAKSCAACATPAMISCGRGGQPDTQTSTGIYLSKGPSMEGLPAKTLPLAGQEPMATTALGPQT